MSFSAPTRERSTPVLPLSAMVDVMFLLLIFFMTASVFREEERQIDVALPSAETGQAPASRTQIFITITADGGIFLGDQLMTFETLPAKLKRLVELYPNESVVVRGDMDAKLGLAVRVIDTVKASGLRNVLIATTKPESEL